jgi:hypothetical protein
MAKRKTAKICVHCLKPLPSRAKTKDHAPPKKWLPVGSPQRTAPACSDCNARYGELENLLLKYLGLCFRDPRARYLKEIALRAGAPEAAKGPADARARKKWQEHIHKHLDETRGHVPPSMTPGFEPARPELAARGALILPVFFYSAFIQKCVHVLTWTEFHEHIGSELRVVPIPHVEAERFAAVVAARSAWIVHAPGIETSIAEDATARIWAFSFFDQLRLLAVVAPHECVPGWVPKPEPMPPLFKRPRFPGEE